MREITLQAEVRTQLRKQIGSLRRSGKIPGVYYIHGEPNIPIAVQEQNLRPLIYTSETHVINLKFTDGSDKSCILRDIQFDPLTDRPIHFDLQGLRTDEEINLEVPVIVTGAIPVGVRDGGVLQLFTHRLKISCLPKDIPEHIEVNAENLKVNHFIHAGDLNIENVTILEDKSTTLVGVVPPTVEKEVAPAAAPTEVVEPEVIAKGKKLEEGAEGEGEKKAEAQPKASPAKEEKKKAD